MVSTIVFSNKHCFSQTAVSNHSFNPTVVSTTLFSTKYCFNPIEYYLTMVSTTVFFEPNLICFS
ncbi:hypothetical protein Hanom_Chr11g01000921 [Helianthus anomalus]